MLLPLQVIAVEPLQIEIRNSLLAFLSLQRAEQDTGVVLPVLRTAPTTARSILPWNLRWFGFQRVAFVAEAATDKLHLRTDSRRYHVEAHFLVQTVLPAAMLWDNRVAVERVGALALIPNLRDDRP